MLNLLIGPRLNYAPTKHRPFEASFRQRVADRRDGASIRIEAQGKIARNSQASVRFEVGNYMRDGTAWPPHTFCMDSKSGSCWIQVGGREGPVEETGPSKGNSAFEPERPHWSYPEEIVQQQDDTSTSKAIGEASCYRKLIQGRSGARTEAWFSPRLCLVLQERTTTASEESIWEMTDVKLREPDAGLFELPSMTQR